MTSIRFACAWVLVLAASAVPARAEGGTPHPLDPLAREEIVLAREVLVAAGRVPEGTLFPLVALREPAKASVLAWKPGDPVERRAFVVLVDRRRGETHEAVVDLVGRRVESFERIPGVQPNVLEEEYETVPPLVKADPRWQAAMRRRGIEDFEKVLIDVWAPGLFPAPAPPGSRLLRTLTFLRGEQRNAYGRPVEGLVAVVDAGRGRVVEVIDRGGAPLPPPGQDLDPESIGPQLPAPKPLVSAMPEGPSFVVEGHEVRWQSWRFRFALHPREGPVLHRVGWEEDGRVRSILHRASISEMVVPYGDPDDAWAWRNAFDEGEYGLGRPASVLVPGREVPEHARLFTTWFAGDDGTPYEAPDTLALYERDGGLLWKHFDEDAKRVDARRARELVLESMVTIGNYDYGMRWIFRQDGSLEFEVLLTGILLVKAVAGSLCENCPPLAEGRDPPPAPTQRYGRLVGPRVLAVNHEHFFSLRLDFDVDGTGNSLAEENLRALPRGPANPHGNAFVLEETLLATERAATRDLDLASHRGWRVFNPSVRSVLGHLVGYRLVPGENAVPYADPCSLVRRRARFLDHPLWATRLRPRQGHAAGYYPNQGGIGTGLPAWVADDESLVNQDLVLWYTFGVAHAPRPEEWPVMSAHRAGVRFVPDGFFSRNPALAVPPSSPP